MNISKSKGLSLTAVFIILVVYNVIAFVLPFDRDGMFWTGYGFSMAAILLTAGVGFYALGHEGLRSKVYGWPLLTLAWYYLIVQLIISLLQMVLPFIPFQYGIVLNVILLGACLVGLIATNIGKEEIERIDEIIKGKVFYIKSVQADLEGMVGRITDETAKKTVKDLAETIRYSDPISNPQLAAIENKIEAKVAGLVNAVDSSDFATIQILCGEVHQLITERNRRCKMLK